MYWIDHQTPTSINTLLENESITLSELLDQDDILSECQASNKKLIEFLVRPNIIHELIKLITEEPPASLEMRYRYRHSAIACDIITSRIPSFSENMAGNTDALGKLYSFTDCDPPLNPLLASFFAKTIQVFFAHSTAHQDWYTYQVMCLQVIEFFKSCPAFLPNLLKHIGTSAIMNSLQYITQVSVDDMKADILVWLNCQGLIENIVGIICGTNVPLKIRPSKADDEYSRILDECAAEKSLNQQNETVNGEVEQNNAAAVSKGISNLQSNLSGEVTDKTDGKPSEVIIPAAELTASDTLPESKDPPSPSLGETVDDKGDAKPSVKPVIVEEKATPKSDTTEIRLLTNRCKNAADLMCFFIQNGRENSLNTKYFENPLLTTCTSETTIQGLLDSMFAAPINIKKHAVVCGIQVLLSLLNDFSGQPDYRIAYQAEIHRIAAFILPWLPHFKQLMTDPLIQPTMYQNKSPGRHVGLARLTVVQFLTVLVDTDTCEVSEALIHNNFINLLLDMFLEYKWNNFLHDYVECFINKAINTQTQRDTYRKHILVDCGIMQRIVNAWNENDKDQSEKKPRNGYMGHLIQIANHVQECVKSSPDIAQLVPDDAKNSWTELVMEKLDKVNAIHDTCLGGHHPSTVNVTSQEILEEHSNYMENSLSHPHDVNFNDNDTYDVSDDMMNDTTDTKDDFEAMCENHAGSIGDCFNDTTDEWTHANIKELDWVQRDFENLSTAASADLSINNSSPWGEMSSFNEDQAQVQAGWADFDNLQETAGISKVPNDFTCQSFAAFDHGNDDTPNLCRLPDSIMNSSSDLSILNDEDKDECNRNAADSSAAVISAGDAGDPKYDRIVATTFPSGYPETGNLTGCNITKVSFADIVRQPAPVPKELPVEKDLVNNTDSVQETGKTEELPVTDSIASSENKNVSESALPPVIHTPGDAPPQTQPDSCLTSLPPQDDNANPAPAPENPPPSNLSIDNQR